MSALLKSPQQKQLLQSSCQNCSLQRKGLKIPLLQEKLFKKPDGSISGWVLRRSNPAQCKIFIGQIKKNKRRQIRPIADDFFTTTT